VRAAPLWVDAPHVEAGPRRTDNGQADEMNVRRVLVEPIGVTVEVADGRTLLDAITNAAVSVPTDCRGRGVCGKCLVRLGTGEVTAPTQAELARLSEQQLEDGWRLACQTSPLSDKVSIDVRETGGRRQILTASKLHHGAVHPAVSKSLVAFQRPSLDDARSDAERLREPFPDVELPLSVLRQAPALLRKHGWRALVTRYGRRIVDIEPPDAGTGAYGAAVDIGTSKIVVYLFDLAGGQQIDQEALENPQMRFGEDVITRITQAMTGSLEELTRSAREGINGALELLFARQGILPRNLYDMTVVGNTAMHHLALGISPEGLGAAPFSPAVNEPLQLRAGDLALAMNPEGGVHFLPPIAGFVGSDALAVAAATRLAARRVPSMAIDIGTNTEISLSVGGRVTSTSCASGPAFEGYQITHGMKAVEGAIERVAFSRDGRVTSMATIGGAPPIGICGSGVVDVLAGLVRAGVVDGSGRMQLHPCVREGRQGREYLVVEGPRGDIVFTQHDVRALQLAKGAIATGWALLTRRAGLDVGDLRHVYVAGAFGNYLDLGNSLAIGLLPPVPRARIAFVGNAAGVGAQMALLDVGARRRIAQLRTRIGFLELATDRGFHEEFATRLGFS
jgi:uncharacterized 2Fe-2S/4Fe-4S cluster protein (DUF4445 family)